MKKTKIEIDINCFPLEIRCLCKDANIYNSSSSANAKVYYLDTGYYIKVAEVNSLNTEACMNRFFYKIGMGVEVIAYISRDNDYLVTKSVTGEDLTHLVSDPEQLCSILASSLKKLHSKSFYGVQTSPSFNRYIEIASCDFNELTYDSSYCTKRYDIGSKEKAWAIIQSNKNVLIADTLIHGDACLPNIIQFNGNFISFIDCNMSGLGDKHIDLYWAIWSLNYNLKTDAYTDLFLDLYGREKISETILYLIAAFESLVKAENSSIK